MRAALLVLLTCAPAWAQQVVTVPGGQPNLTGGRAILTPTSGGGGGTTSLTVVDYQGFNSAYGDPPTIHVVQRAPDLTTRDVPVRITWTGAAPAAPPECQVVNTKSSTVVRSYVTLTSWTASAGTGTGVIPGVPQGSPYRTDCGDSVTHARSGALFGQSLQPWGVGIVAVGNGQSQWPHILGISPSPKVYVAGTSMYEEQYWNTGAVSASTFDMYGNHPPAGGPLRGGGDLGFVSIEDSYRTYIRQVAKGLKDATGTDIPFQLYMNTQNATGAAAWTPGGFHYGEMAQSGTDGPAGTIGLNSPLPWRSNSDFELALFEGGAADAGVGVTAFVNQRAALHDGYVALANTPGRTAANLKMLLAVVGGEDTNGQGQSKMEYAREGALRYVRDTAPSTGRTGAGLMFVETDLPNDGSHITDVTVGLRARDRIIQATLYALGAAPYGAAGPYISSVVRVNATTIRVTVTHDGGTALQGATTGALTGFVLNSAADFSGTYYPITGAAVSGAATIDLTVASGTPAGIYLKFLGARVEYLIPGTPYSSGAPDIRNLPYDNARFPRWTNKIGTAEEQPVGFPVRPTIGAMLVNRRRPGRRRIHLG